MRLKTPKVRSKPRMAEETRESRCCRTSVNGLSAGNWLNTLLSNIRCIITKLHRTTRVSTELEKV